MNRKMMWLMNIRLGYAIIYVEYTYNLNQIICHRQKYYTYSIRHPYNMNWKLEKRWLVLEITEKFLNSSRAQVYHPISDLEIWTCQLTLHLHLQ
jgi:hypothetical protein